MEHPPKETFQRAKSEALTLSEAIAKAKVEIAALNPSVIDAVSRCERSPDGSWLIVLDLIESPSRMGENDLLISYELRLDADGFVLGVERLGRYRREDDGRV